LFLCHFTETNWLIMLMTVVFDDCVVDVEIKQYLSFLSWYNSFYRSVA
jgi:hypothetical protein